MRFRFADGWFGDVYYDRPRAPRPLLLGLSFCRPHYPYFTSEELLSFYVNRVEVPTEEPVV